jgi:hypothetical protein
LIEAAFLPWGLMMTPTRRADDDDDAQSKVFGMVKPMMMPVFGSPSAV